MLVILRVDAVKTVGLYRRPNTTNKVLLHVTRIEIATVFKRLWDAIRKIYTYNEEIVRGRSYKKIAIGNCGRLEAKFRFN